jgi:hypothetical protein
MQKDPRGYHIARTECYYNSNIRAGGTLIFSSDDHGLKKVVNYLKWH